MRTCADNTLTSSHAALYANFDAVNPSNINAYLCNLSNLKIAQWPCFVACIGGTKPSLVVLHSLAMHQQNPQAPSKYNSSKFAFLNDVIPGDCESFIELRTPWYFKDLVQASTYNTFRNAIKEDPKIATVFCSTKK